VSTTEGDWNGHPRRGVERADPATSPANEADGNMAKAAQAKVSEKSRSVAGSEAAAKAKPARPGEAAKETKDSKKAAEPAKAKPATAKAADEELKKKPGAKSDKGAGKPGKPDGKDAKKGEAPKEPEKEDEAEEAEPDFSDEPSAEALAEAQAEAEKALKEMERQGGGDSTLSRYFREMASHRVLTPQEEIEAAKEVERLEIGYWEALFALPLAIDTVGATIERYVEQPLAEIATLRKLSKNVQRATSKLIKKDQEKWDETSLSLATKLRALDSDRIFVNEADRAVHRVAGELAVDRDLVAEGVQITPAFRKFLEGVEGARTAQQESKNRFVAANLRLVVSIARRYNRGRLPLIDLIQEGNIGLMKAVERFDHNRGYRFSTYASWWIRHAISRALADKGRAVRIPVHMLDTYNRVARATQAIATRTGQEPTPEELEKETGIAAEKLEKIKGYWAETPFSLDRPVNDEDGRKFIDFLEQENVPTPYEQLVSKTWSDEVRRLLDTLSPMEARILRWRFGLDDEDELTLKEIGDKYNLSRERIRQLQEQALAKIRRQIKE
jgi:RNA polymerase primary sigma factor